MRGKFLVLLAMSCLGTAANADDGRHLSVTVYTPAQALVEDERMIDFPVGRSTIGFPDVSANIRPETASLSADGVTVIEQNFDFDLLTPQKLMEKALGNTVRIVRTNPGTGAEIAETATVLSTEQGVVLKIGDHIEVLRDDGVPTRVIFDKVPDNLRARPTLSILTASARAGRRPAILRYMTTGLGWKADYVASFDDAAGTIDLQGWVTLTNDTRIAYDNARVRVATGGVSGGGLGVVAGRGDNGANDRTTVFDLPEPVTIADRQAKQIGMVDLKAVPAEKVYRSVWMARGGTLSFSGSGQPAKADVVLRFDAKDAAGALWRLPRGALRAFIRDAKGAAQFVGEAQIGDIAAGGKVQAIVSRAFDIEVTPRLVSDQKVGDSKFRRAVEYKVANASDTEVTVEIEQGGLGPDAHVDEESVAGVVLDAYRRQWAVKVPAHGETLLTAVFEQGR
ncbi:hypothetical protein [Telmatospirillum sp.]|uniref:DUF4139 domain-containing protein n=1 Tax=Telmatospirillum sp. TaxID=2079197 RepID=UPI00284A2024|nr:hypothetical protein [Telmatospirillum sp.]MDR3438677.1 hypothetical protein [Telmatospirillum sp.]